MHKFNMSFVFHFCILGLTSWIDILDLNQPFKGWNLRALQNETRMRTSILNMEPFLPCMQVAQAKRPSLDSLLLAACVFTSATIPFTLSYFHWVTLTSTYGPPGWVVFWVVKMPFIYHISPNLWHCHDFVSPHLTQGHFTHEARAVTMKL
jgi:hypothetical protein